MHENIIFEKPVGISAHMAMSLSKLQNPSKRLKYAGKLAATALVLSVSPTFCATSLDGVVTELLNFIFNLARVVGIVIAVNGVFNWVLANKDENADGQARGIKLVVCGLALVFLKSLANPIIKAVGF